VIDNFSEIPSLLEQYLKDKTQLHTMKSAFEKMPHSQFSERIQDLVNGMSDLRVNL
jgi:hypothetical protein